MCFDSWKHVRIMVISDLLYDVLFVCIFAVLFLVRVLFSLDVNVFLTDVFYCY